ncbi:MAG TPA: glycosyltransferase family 39 protein [Ohtaekwangia sp.]|uniref:ArnT family glycosyltransferase n=1 Tax=Ohtaekwangia sp. TaxID=2066019 RepID=UPI002F953D5A
MNKNLLILLILASVIYTANIWGTSVYILDEAKNAGCAMEMYQRGDWVVPTFNDALRTDKPPLHYYFMRAGYSILGVTPFGARIFSTVMGILTVLVVFLYCRRLLNEDAAFYTGMILVASLQLGVQFHLAVPDPYLIFFLTLGWLSFIYAYVEKKPLHYYIFYVAIACAALAKGPVAVVFSGLLVLIFLFVQRDLKWKSLMRMRVLQGAALFCVIVLPWYIAVGIATDGAWLEQFFFKHNVGRFTSSMEGHGGFPLASVVIVFAALMPFSFFVPQAMKMIWKDQKKDAFLQFSFIAMSIVIVFFAFSRTILPSYPEPAVPFFATLLGYFFQQVQKREKVGKMKLRINGVVYFVIALLIPFAVWFALREENNLKDLASLAVYFVLLPLGAGTALVYLWKKDLDTALYIYTLTAVIFLMLFFYAAFPEVDARNPVSQSIDYMHHHSAKPVVAYRDFNPAYIFSFQKPVKKFENTEELASFADSHEHFYIVTQERYLPELYALSQFNIVYQGKDLFERPVTVVLEKR